MSRKNKYKSLKAFAWITQLGISMVTPLILCIIVASYIKSKFNVGDQIMLVAIIIGIGSGFMTLVNYIKTIKKEIEKEDENAK